MKQLRRLGAFRALALARARALVLPRFLVQDILGRRVRARGCMGGAVFVYHGFWSQETRQEGLEFIHDEALPSDYARTRLVER